MCEVWGEPAHRAERPRAVKAWEHGAREFAHWTTVSSRATWLIPPLGRGCALPNMWPWGTARLIAVYMDRG
jgi:hypothetical protein